MAVQASDGDVIEVGPGTYYEHIPVPVIDLTFVATDGPFVTILDGSQPINGRQGSILYSAVPGAATSLSVQGFTFQNGQGYDDGFAKAGGAIYWAEDVGIRDQTVTITNCRFLNNILPPGYGGAGAWFSNLHHVVLEDCEFSGNWTDNHGNAVFAQGQATGDITLRRCTFHMGDGSSDSVGLYIETVVMDHCFFDATDYNTASGSLWLVCPEATLTNNIFIDHGTGAEATEMLIGTATIGYYPLQRLTLEGNLFWNSALSDSASPWTVDIAMDNHADVIHGNTFVHAGLLEDGGGQPLDCRDNVFYKCTTLLVTSSGGTVSCCDSWPGPIQYGAAYTVLDSVRADPLFCGESYGDFHVSPSSPCAPGSHFGCGLIGACGVACDPIPVQTTTWGQIKSRFEPPASSLRPAARVPPTSRDGRRLLRQVFPAGRPRQD